MEEDVLILIPWHFLPLVSPHKPGTVYALLWSTYMDIITIFIRHLLVPLFIDMVSNFMSDTVRKSMLKSHNQSMHRTTALHFIEYLETPPSTNGIPSLASCCRYLNFAVCSKSVSLQHVVFRYFPFPYCNN